MKLVRSVGKNTIIPMKDVLEFFVEKIETDALLTTFFVTGVIAGVVLATIYTKNATDGVAPPNEPPTPPQPPPPLRLHHPVPWYFYSMVKIMYSTANRSAESYVKI
ncbi:MAG: hypothetical protein R2942_03095 [Ignavibacteria bacterium]